MSYQPNPKHIRDDFYAVEETGWIPVNKSGMILDHRGNIYPGILSQGYMLFNRLDEQGIHRTIQVHRIVAMTYCSCDLDIDIRNLHVNHRDGNKLNNHVSNLEWCTAAENNMHAHRTGLVSRNIQIEVKDLTTSEITLFYSIRQAEEALNIRYGNLHRYLTGGRIAPFRKKYEVKYPEEEWKFSDKDIGKWRKTEPRKLYARAMVHGNPNYIFPSIGAAVRELRLDQGTLVNYLNNPDKGVYHGYLWRYFDTLFLMEQESAEDSPNTIKIKPKDYFRKDLAPNEAKIVQTTNLATGEILYWKNYETLAKFLGKETHKLMKNVSYHKGTYLGYRFKIIYKARTPIEEYNHILDLLSSNRYQSLS